MGEAADLSGRYFQALSDGDVDGAVGMLADDCDFQTPMGPIPGPMIRGYLGGFDSAFPGARFDLTTMVEGDDGMVAVEGVYSGTHGGALSLPDGNTLPATGREVSAPFVTVLKVSGGRITAHRPYWDLARFMQQLTG
jgi:steroid delta-isomerase-like uncharacterized protein